jgi:hypothetical protein
MREVRQTNAEQLVVDATSGVVPGTPVAWTDGRLSGYVYDFVTWHTTVVAAAVARRRMTTSA